MSGLHVEELLWLAALAAQRIRRNEKSLARFTGDEDRRARIERNVVWQRACLAHLDGLIRARKDETRA